MNTLRRMHAGGRITDEQYRDARSRLMKDRLVASGELRPGQEPRRELGTAMLVRRKDNEMYRPPRLLPFAFLALLLLTMTACVANDGSNFIAAAVQRQNRPIDREEREGLSAAGAEIVSCGDPAPDPKISPCATVWRTCKRRDGKKVIAIMPNDPKRCVATDDICQ